MTTGTAAANGVRREGLEFEAELEDWRLEKRQGDVLFEVVEGGRDRPTEIVFRRDGVAPAESYSKLEIRHMIKMKMTSGGFDGLTSYTAGETVRVALDHAKTAFLAGNGRPVDDNGKLLPLKRAAQLLGVRDDDLAGATDGLRLALAEDPKPKKKG